MDGTLLLFAQVHAAANPSAPHMPMVPLVAVGVGAIALAVLAVMIVSALLSASAERETNHPRRLLAELCEAHGFRRRQQRALSAAASTLGVRQPARLFLEPKLLAEASAHPRLSSRRQELAEIASELFGAPGEL